MAKKKKSASEAGLAKLVKAYNQKINRALQSGRLTKETAPPTMKAREIKALAVGMTAKERGLFFRSWASNLKSIMKTGALELTTTKGGQTVTRYEAEIVKRMGKTGAKRAKEEQARAEKDAVKIPLVGGTPVGEGKAWTREARLPKPHELPPAMKSIEARLSGVKQLAIHAYGGEWAQYRANLLKNIADKYSEDVVAAFRKMLAKVSNAQLEKAYHEGKKFADQKYHYGKFFTDDKETGYMLQTLADMAGVKLEKYWKQAV